MPITLNCPKCHKPFRVRDESVGMRVKCPTCAVVLQVPADLASGSHDNLKPDEASSNPGIKKDPSSFAGEPRPGGVPSESVFSQLPGPSPSSGPPSLVGGPSAFKLKDDDEADNGRPARSAPASVLPPIPSISRPATKPRPPEKKAPPRPDAEGIAEDAVGWGKVRTGVRLVQIALFFSLLFPLTEIGLAAYCVQEYGTTPDKVLKPPAAVLGLKGMDLFAESRTAAWLAGGLLFFFFAGLGLLKLRGIPRAAQSKGLATGTLFLTFLCFAAFAVYSLPFIKALDLFDIPSLPREVFLFTAHAVVYVVAITMVWFVSLMGVAGQALGTPRVWTDAAYSALLVALLIPGIQIADYYYPLTLASPKVARDKTVDVYVTDKAVQAIVCVLIAARLMSIAGVVRRAVRRWREDNREVLALTSE